MNPEEALAILSKATEPENAGRISRAGYVQINLALVAIEAALKELAALKSPAPVVPDNTIPLKL